MSKEKNKNRDQKKGFKIPEDARKLAKLTQKKFKKESGDYYDSKKDLKKGYYAQIIEYLPESIQLLVRYGHLAEVKETREAIYAKLTDREFVKYLKKDIKSGGEFDNMELLPNLIYDIMKEAQRAVEMELQENPDSKVEYDLDDLVEISQLILKKKIKKLVKAGIDENVAFDVLSIIPDPEILKRSQYFHIRSLFTVLYEHAKKVEIDFSKLIKIILKGAEDYTGSVISFALLERKEKVANMTDGQRSLYQNITEWSLKTLEDMNKDEINNVLRYYVESRKRDESKNCDSNRRYYLSSLPSDDYPHITKAMERIVSRDESLKKYF